MNCKCKPTVGYALVNTQLKTIHRASFSISLLEHIQKDFPELSLAKVHYEFTKEDTGMYAISKLSGWILRVTFYRSLAEKWVNEKNFLSNVKVIKVEVLQLNGQSSGLITR